MNTFRWVLLVGVFAWLGGEAMAQKPVGKKQGPVTNQQGMPSGALTRKLEGPARLSGKGFPPKKGLLPNRLLAPGSLRRSPAIAISGGPDIATVILQFLDVDQDQKISPSESPQKLNVNWELIDTNGDQFLDQAEIRKVVERTAMGAADATVLSTVGRSPKTLPGIVGAPGEIKPRPLKSKRKGQDKK